MTAWPRRDGDLDGRVGGGEGGEARLEEGAGGGGGVSRGARRHEWPHLLQTSTAAGPVAIVEVEAFALQDEGSHAVLRARDGVRMVRRGWSGAEGRAWLTLTYLRLCYGAKRCERHLDMSRRVLWLCRRSWAVWTRLLVSGGLGTRTETGASEVPCRRYVAGCHLRVRRSQSKSRVR